MVCTSGNGSRNNVFESFGITPKSDKQKTEFLKLTILYLILLKKILKKNFKSKLQRFGFYLIYDIDDSVFNLTGFYFTSSNNYLI